MRPRHPGALAHLRAGAHAGRQRPGALVQPPCAVRLRAGAPPLPYPGANPVPEPVGVGLAATRESVARSDDHTQAESADTNPGSHGGTDGGANSCAHPDADREPGVNYRTDAHVLITATG